MSTHLKRHDLFQAPELIEYGHAAPEVYSVYARAWKLEVNKLVWRQIAWAIHWQAHKMKNLDWTHI